MKVPNYQLHFMELLLSLSRLQNEGSQLKTVLLSLCYKSIKATE